MCKLQNMHEWTENSFLIDQDLHKGNMDWKENQRWWKWFLSGKMSPSKSKGHFFRGDKKKKEKIMFYCAIWKTLLSKGQWKWNVFVRSENRSWSLLLLSDLRKSHQPPSHTLENVKNNFFMQKKKKFRLDPEIDGKLFVIPLWPPSYWANPNLWSPASWAVGWYQPPWRKKTIPSTRSQWLVYLYGMDVYHTLYIVYNSV